MELWDAYDKDMHKIAGVSLVRGERIPEGIYHLVCNVLVKHKDGDILIMQRDPSKHHGGMWEATAGGSALQGETPAECALRELKEETGITAKELILLGIDSGPDRIYSDFLCITDWDKNSVVLQKGETSDFKWVSKDKLIEMRDNDLISQRMKKYLEGI